MLQSARMQGRTTCDRMAYIGRENVRFQARPFCIFFRLASPICAGSLSEGRASSEMAILLRFQEIRLPAADFDSVTSTGGTASTRVSREILRFQVRWPGPSESGREPESRRAGGRGNESRGD